MGFWNSILNGIADAGSWISNNSDSILNAVNVIAKAAGAVALDEASLAQDDNALPKLVANLTTAAGKLQQTAESLSPRPAPVKQGDPIHGPLHLPGVWPQPAIVAEGQAPPDVGADVDKFLAINDLPTVLGTGTDAVDVGKLLAAQMFAPVSTTKNDGSPFVSPAPLLVDALATHGIRITGQHVYYPVPLGNPGTNDAWHSHTLLWVEQAPQFRENWAKQKRMLSVKPRPSGLAAGASYNTATVSAQWSGAKNVPMIMSQAVHAVQQLTNPTFTYLPPAIIDGTKYTYQFQMSTDVGSAAVLGAFSNAIHGLLSPTGADPLPAMPVTKIESQGTIVG
jgi:hypothetical protein